MYAMLKHAKDRFGVVAPFGGPTSSGMLNAALPAERGLRSGLFHARARRAEHHGR